MQDVSVTNINIITCTLKAEVKYRATAVCIELVNLTVQLLYNMNNVQHIITKPYVVNTTDSFILSLLQPNSTISYTMQVINTASNIVGSASTGSFILPSIISSTTGISNINIGMKCTCILVIGGITAIVSTPCVNEYAHAGINVYFIHIILLWTICAIL